MEYADFTDSVLYYPTIEFQDEIWIKSALCVWDSIYRIVPEGYRPCDSEAVEEAAEAGAIVNLIISRADLEKCASAFEQFWETVPVIPAGVEGWEELDVKLHPDKIDERIRPLLQSLAKKVDPDGWLGLSAPIANVYMLFLAENISRRRQIPKLTDNSDMFALMHYFSNDGNIGEYVYNRESTEFTTALLLSTLIPAELSTTSMKRVLELREPLGEGRRAFRTSVSEFAGELSRVEDRNRAKKLADAFADRLEKSERTVKQRLRELSRRYLVSTLSVGLPTAITAFSAFGMDGDPFRWSNIGRAGLIGAVAAVADASRSRRSI